MFVASISCRCSEGLVHLVFCFLQKPTLQTAIQSDMCFYVRHLGRNASNNYNVFILSVQFEFQEGLILFLLILLTLNPKP